MADLVLVTVTAIAENKSDTYLELETIMKRKTLKSIFPQMLNAMGGFVPQIEDPNHPLNGLQILGICIELPDDERLKKSALQVASFWEVHEHHFDDDDDDGDGDDDEN